MSGTGFLVNEMYVLQQTLMSLAREMPPLNGHVVTVKRGTKQITNICFSDKALGWPVSIPFSAVCRDGVADRHVLWSGFTPAVCR